MFDPMPDFARAGDEGRKVIRIEGDQLRRQLVDQIDQAGAKDIWSQVVGRLIRSTGSD